jgi:hypothetical protein
MADCPELVAGHDKAVVRHRKCPLSLATRVGSSVQQGERLLLTEAANEAHRLKGSLVSVIPLRTAMTYKLPACLIGPASAGQRKLGLCSFSGSW